MKLLRQSGFTLIELVIYMAVFAIAAGGLTLIVTDSLRIQGREAANTEVSQQLSFVLNTVQRLINDASTIEAVYQTGNQSVGCSDAIDYCTLKLRLEDDSLDPTWIVATAEGVNIVQGDDSENDGALDSASDRRLTTDKVVVDYMRFTKYEFEGGHASARISLSLTYNTDNPKFAVSKSVQSAIGKASAAVFDDNLLPNADNSFDVGQISGNKRWRSAAFSSDVTIGGTLGVGTASPASTALLDLTSTTKGFLAPRLTTTERDAIGSPATGLLVYNTTDNKYNFFNSTLWETLGSLWTATSTALYYNGGNVGVGTNNPTYKLDVAGSGRFTSPVSVSTPIAASDAATKAYVDAASGGGCYEAYGTTTCASGYTVVASGYTNWIAVWGDYSTSWGAVALTPIFCNIGGTPTLTPVPNIYGGEVALGGGTGQACRICCK